MVRRYRGEVSHKDADSDLILPESGRKKGLSIVSKFWLVLMLYFSCCNGVGDRDVVDSDSDRIGSGVCVLVVFLIVVAATAAISLHGRVVVLWSLDLMRFHFPFLVRGESLGL
ncbi:Hypothetical predicted protein [Octopus vulgaris]|uniref:Transmembrane protein n=1 Tax=Octopus vulgaris TaxID=6645 RepID=A0AA36AF65_OCTVU|nr:Hypothetical predicted protein [Octopus vulgaris]